VTEVGRTEAELGRRKIAYRGFIKERYGGSIEAALERGKL
jgi:hypothetical protein